ncbi:MAG: hypothetical protein QM780_04030 [Hyphomicrobium sp.]|uniref:hypothetical protein n=1 Tax=Hyphomicrobium sp. TaxID=82 RepID=UPI0039E69A07
MLFARRAILAAAFCFASAHAWATKAKLDSETCDSLRLEQIKFRQSGILDDLNKGAAWAKANLSAERLRDIQHYLELDEQVQFGCRDAKITVEAKRASEAAARIEINSDADPTAPIAKDPPKPGAAAAKKDGPQKATKKAAHKGKSAKASSGKDSKADRVPEPSASPAPAVAASGGGSGEASASGGAADAQTPSLPAFGFGDTTVFPQSSP